MFENLILRGATLVERLEVVKVAYDAGELDKLESSRQIPVGELEGWFDAATAVISESFGEDSPQMEKWKRQQEFLRRIDERDRDAGRFNSVAAHIANIANLRGLLIEFEDIWQARQPRSDSRLGDSAPPFSAPSAVKSTSKEEPRMPPKDDEPAGKPGKATQIITTLITAIAAILVGYMQFCRPHVEHKSAATDPAQEARRFAGRVLDAETGHEVRGAKVSLEVQGVPPILFTDSEGVFFFNVPREERFVRIRIEAPGYQSYDRRTDLTTSTEVAEIRLHPVAPPSASPKPSSDGNAAASGDPPQFEAANRLESPAKDKSTGPSVKLVQGVWIENGPFPGEILSPLKRTSIKVTAEYSDRLDLIITTSDNLSWKAQFDKSSRTIEWLEGSKIPPDYTRNMTAAFVYDDIIITASNYVLSRPGADLSRLKK